MVKKLRIKKPAKRKASNKARPARTKSTRRSKPGVRIKLKKNAKIMKRLAELGVAYMPIAEKALSLFFRIGATAAEASRAGNAIRRCNPDVERRHSEF